MNKNNLLLVLTAVTGIAILVLLTVFDYLIPRVTSALYLDVSSSNTKNKAFVEQLCKTRLNQLKEGDILIEAEFADTTFVSKNQAFEESMRLKFQEECQKVANLPAGVGKNGGTPLLPVLNSLELEITKQHKNGNKNRTVAIVVVQDNEPLQYNSPEKSDQLAKKVESFTKLGNVIVFIGSDLKLQQELKSALANITNSQVCTYTDAKACLEWAFNLARK